jgi:hypothetical protein
MNPHRWRLQYPSRHPWAVAGSVSGKHKPDSGCVKPIVAKHLPKRASVRDLGGARGMSNRQEVKVQTRGPNGGNPTPKRQGGGALGNAGAYSTGAPTRRLIASAAPSS